MAREVRFRVRWGAGDVRDTGAWPPRALGADPEEAVTLTVERRDAGERRGPERRQDATRCLSCRRKVTRRRGERRR